MVDFFSTGSKHVPGAPVQHPLHVNLPRSILLLFSFPLRSNFLREDGFIFCCCVLRAAWREIIARKIIDCRWRGRWRISYAENIIFNFRYLDRRWLRSCFEVLCCFVRRSLWHSFAIGKYPFEFLISVRSFDKHALCDTHYLVECRAKRADERDTWVEVVSSECGYVF